MLIALILALIAGLADLLGGYFAVAKKVSHQALSYFIAVSSGFILAVTILDLYPEVMRELESGPLYILLGFITIFILENFFAVHVHHGPADMARVGEHRHSLFGHEHKDDIFEQHSLWAAWGGFLIHTFFDGAAIVARMTASPVGGVLVFIAVLSHKLPEGFAMASIFSAGKFGRLASFLAAASLGAATILGALAVFWSGKSDFSLIFLALATGTFTYIAASELVPHISGTKDRKGILFFLLGVGLFYLTSGLLSGFGLK